MLATTQRMTTTGPRSGGSRFFASPRRAPRSRNAPPEKRGAGRKTASRKFFSAPPTSRPENSTQTLGTHQRNSVWAYDFALGCAVAPNSSAETVVLGADLNYNKSDTSAWFNANYANTPKDVFVVSGEGTRTSVEDKKGNPLNAQQLAKRIQSDPYYKPGTAVWLLACNTGEAGGIGSQLAPIMRVPVTAPNNYIFLNPDGTWIVAGILKGSSPPKPDPANPGQMVTFQPAPLPPPTRPRKP